MAGSVGKGKKPGGKKKKTDGIRTRGAPTKALALRKPGRQANQDRPLTPAQIQFIARYIVRGHATRAYQDSHPNATWTTSQCEGSKLLKDPRIANEIKRWTAEVKANSLHDAARILRTLSVQAFTPITALLDADGMTVPPQHWPLDVALAVKKMKRTEILTTGGKDGEEKLLGHTIEIEMVDKFQPLQALGKHENLFIEQVHHTADEDLLKALERGNERALARK